MRFEYPAVFKKREDGSYEGRFPDLPGAEVTGGSMEDVIRNAINAEREWMLTEFWEEDPKVPPISDAEDLVLGEGEFVRQVAAIVKFQEGWEE